MKYLKMLGVAAIAAAPVMAFMGADSAFAQTTLCKEKNLTSCYGVGTTLHGVSSPGQGLNRPTFTGPNNIDCDSTIEGKIQTATTPLGKATALTWTGCEGGTVVTDTLGSFQIHHSSGNNGTITISDFVVQTTFVGVICHYGGMVTGTFTGSATLPQINITADLAKINTLEHPSSGFCPEKVNWHATYAIDNVNGKASGLFVVTGV
jgi:hypothetical protein